MKPLCIYHAHCSDGLMAAAIVQQHHIDVDMHPGSYNEDPPNVSNREVLLVDFSYKRDVLLKMAKQAKSILILDHHKTAEKELVDLPSNVTTIFDMEQSGCGITWGYYFSEYPKPLAVQLIEDRDLWKFKYPSSKAFHAYTALAPRTVESMAILLETDDEDIVAQCRVGGSILRYADTSIKTLIRISAFPKKVLGYEVPVMNCPPMWASEAGHIMAQNELFSATYYESDTHRMWSLRSSEDGMDVGALAATVGGGGHIHAAGFKEEL
jgi:uncharacterized protein